MNVVLIGLSFNSENKGCEALSFSFAKVLNDIAVTNSIKVTATAIVYKSADFTIITNTDIKISYIDIRMKKVSFWKAYKNALKNADIVFDFTAGDSFSDIYGMKRFMNATLIKQVAINAKKCFVLGPQTYGPFKHWSTRTWAKRIIKTSSYVFSRDSLSTEVIKKLTGINAITVTDVAFSLPYEKRIRENHEFIEVGLNPSGLLFDTQFPLSINYRDYLFKLMEFLVSDSKYRVFLIPHVWSDSIDTFENDLAVCNILKEKYPSVQVSDAFNTPMDAKSFISGLDIFIGARMHATIASFSSGVATIPVSYSYKFEGLYESIGYPYIIKARSDTLEQALSQTINWVKDYRMLQENAVSSMEAVAIKRDLFISELKNIINSVTNK